jgi:RHS repeat-associated protein
VWIGEELNFSIPDGDWSQRIRAFSPYPEIGVDELTYRRIGDDASGDRYVLRDGNNNVIALTDAGQRIRTQYSYEPYGQTKLSGDDDVNVQQYTARENDGTGLYYYRERYYSPATARFISEDSIGYASGQTNAYAYVGGNPISYTDPEGLARGVPLAGNEPGGFRLNPNGLDVDYFDGAGNLCAQYHESHGTAHGHNFGPSGRDNTHIPMSPIRWR